MTTPAVPQIGAGGDQIVSAGGQRTALGLTTATVVKTGPGRACRVTVVIGGSAAGTINDVATTSGASMLNAVGVLPTTTGTYQIDWPCQTGIVIIPGVGQTIAIAYL